MVVKEGFKIHQEPILVVRQVAPILVTAEEALQVAAPLPVFRVVVELLFLGMLVQQPWQQVAPSQHIQLVPPPIKYTLLQQMVRLLYRSRLQMLMFLEVELFAALQPSRHPEDLVVPFTGKHLLLGQVQLLQGHL